MVYMKEKSLGIVSERVFEGTLAGIVRVEINGRIKGGGRQGGVIMSASFVGRPRGVSRAGREST